MGDRPGALPRPRPRLRATRRRSTAGRCPAPPASTLDPVLELAPAHPARAGRLGDVSFATGVAASREAGLKRWRSSTTTRVAAPARVPAGLARIAQSALHHLGISERGGDALRAAGLAGACTWTARCAAPATCSRQNPLGQDGLWRPASPAICRSCSSTSTARASLPLVRQVLQAQEYWRLKGLRADVVILNEQPSRLSGRDADAARGAARRGTLVGLEASRRRASICCAPMPCRAPQRMLLSSVGTRGARASDRGELRRATRRAVARSGRREPAAAALRAAAHAAARPPRATAPSPVATCAACSRNGRRRLQRRRARVRGRPRGRQETPAPWANVIANPGFGTDRHRARDRRTPGPRTAARTG